MRKRSFIYRNRRQDLYTTRRPCGAVGFFLTWSFILVVALFPGSPLRAADTLPERLTDHEYRALMATLSEPGGAFQFENLLSNEADFPYIMEDLRRTAPAGGAYLGVGPEQNFTYIAAIRPKIAFIIDIRYQNVIEHLMYKALFDLSPDRATFVSRLFSRNLPEGLSVDATAAQLFDAYRGAPVDQAAFQRNFRDIEAALVEKHGFVLSATERSSLENVYAAFRDFGPQMDYNSRGGIPGGRGGSTPSYASLMTRTDSSGQEWSYLATEENYRFVRDMQRRNLIVPMTGDFGGPKAIRAVARYLKDHGARVSAFYVSNVEGYLFQGGDRQGNPNGGATSFYENVAALPLEPSSAFIRWIPSFGGFGAGTSSIRMAPIPSTLEDFNAGRLTTADFFPGRGRFGRGGRGIGTGMGTAGNIFGRGARAGRLIQNPVSAADGATRLGAFARIALAVAAFLVRYFIISDPLLPRRRVGATYAERFIGWPGVAYRYRLGIPSSKTAAFTLSRERQIDRFFKSIGFGREFQTGDSAFDAQVYVESEHEAVRVALRDSAELRRVMLEAFAGGARSVWSDGRSIYLESRREQRHQGLAVLELTRAEITKSWSRLVTPLGDRFSARPLIVRAVVWAVGAYAVSSIVDWLLSRETLHLDQLRLLAVGGIAAILTIVALLAMTLLLLRRSSRAPRTLVKTALAVVLAAPLFGLQVVSDVNRALDRAPITVTATISRRWETTADRAYYIEVLSPLSSSAAPGSPFPGQSGALRVSRDVFRSVRDGMAVPIVIGEGRLAIPWLRSINGVAVD